MSKQTDLINIPDAITVSGSNVGIGTSPSYTLDVYKSSVGNVASFNSSSGNRSLDITSADNGAYLGAEWDRNINSAGGIHTWSVNDTERMRISSSGQVGIGTSSPSSFWSGGNQLVVGSGTGSQGLTIHSGTTSDAGIYFSDGTAGNALYQGQIFYRHTDDAMVFNTSAAERIRITSSGKLLVNTTATLDAAPSAMLHVYNPTSVAGVFQTDNAGTQAIGVWNKGNSGTRYLVWFESSVARSHVGHISTNGSSTSYVTSSDYRLKENVVDLTGASARVNQLNPSRFNFIVDDTNTLVDGFLAHEVATVVPEAINGTHNEVEVWKDDEELPDGVSVGDNKLDDDGNTIPVYQGIDQSKLVPLLTAALQEALTEIASLKTRVEALEG